MFLFWTLLGPTLVRWRDRTSRLSLLSSFLASLPPRDWKSSLGQRSWKTECNGRISGDSDVISTYYTPASFLFMGLGKALSLPTHTLMYPRLMTPQTSLQAHFECPDLTADSSQHQGKAAPAWLCRAPAGAACCGWGGGRPKQIEGPLLVPSCLFLSAALIGSKRGQPYPLTLSTEIFPEEPAFPVPLPALTTNTGKQSCLLRGLAKMEHSLMQKGRNFLSSRSE